MIIHFIGSKGSIEQEISHYRKIIDYLKSKNHTLVRDWIEDAYNARNAEVDQVIDWSKIDSEDTAAISRADLVIVEATKKSFFVGYRMAQAIQQKKPTLLLYRDGLFPGAMDLSKSADFIRAAEYDDKNIEDILDQFIEENTINVKDMRFNFFIDRQIYNYLRWAAFKTGKTKAEVLRELVKNEIEKKSS